MYSWPANTANPRTQSPPEAHPHRSWSDDHVPPNPRSRFPPNTHTPRAVSFSSSGPAARPNWKDLPPPPPLPPLPPSLLPGFNSPALAHSDRDLFFGGATPYTQPPRQYSHTPLATAGLSQSVVHPSTGPMPNSAPPWPSLQNSSSGSIAAPPVPTRPPFVNGYAHSTAMQAATRPMSSVHVYMTSSSPPVVPPRPSTAHDDMRYSGSASAPAIPPKIFTSPRVAAISSSTPPSKVVNEWLPSSEKPLDESSQPAEVLSSSISNPPVATSQPAKNELSVPPQMSKPQSRHCRSRSAEDIARAMELSLAESQSHYSDSKKIQDEEDRYLQQALADSLANSRMLSHANVESSDVSLNLGEGSSTGSKQTPAPVSEPAATIFVASQAADREAEAEAKRLQRERDGKAALRKLMEQEEKRLAEEAIRVAEQKRELERRDEELARKQLEEDRAQKEELEAQERRDAELARRLASGNEPGPSRVRMSVPPVASAPVSKPSPPEHTRTPASAPATAGEHDSQPPAGPPQYDDVVSAGPPPVPQQNTRPRLSNTSVQTLPAESASQNLRGRTTSAMVTALTPSQERPQFARASSVGAGVAQATTPGQTVNATRDSPRSPNKPAGPSPAAGPAANTPRRPNTRSEAGPSQSNTAGSSGSTSSASHGENGTHELLRGVSFGFEPPVTQLAPVQLSERPPCPPFPEVVTLHPAPAPPFHLMALSWRHMMRLLAQFETRIEASVSTIAQTKDESFLRVVVQFVKLPYTTNDWRTIIYLSIDQQIPPNTPQAFRYTNGDTTMLPYSIARGEAPAHLRISAISHLYAVPLSQATPFPILPLALPNLALYLQSAMRDSRARKVQNDTSNTMRRLARLVSSCYPEEVPSTDTEERESSRGVGGLFKRVVGRKRRDTQGNEEVYDMVTPFRIDKYTTVS